MHYVQYRGGGGGVRGEGGGWGIYTQSFPAILAVRRIFKNSVMVDKEEANNCPDTCAHLGDEAGPDHGITPSRLPQLARHTDFNVDQKQCHHNPQTYLGG